MLQQESKPEGRGDSVEPRRAARRDRSRFTERCLLAIALGATVLGWKVFEFLTDDAFITFRYVSNWLNGWGLTWNPPPFRPVEGYTSFLWVVTLGAVWRFTGVEPPDSANWLSLACGLLTVALVYKLVLRMELPGVSRGGRVAVLALVLLGMVTNRTFLAWLSSGLETAQFNLFFLWWIYEAVTRPARRGRWWGARLSTAAALAALTRPDGLLAVLGTLVLLGLRGLEDRRSGGRALRAMAVSALPLLAVGAHLLWRRATYGVWLPNTYYAKVIEPWPESGWRYAASFVVEYGVWLWLLFAAVWLGRASWTAAARARAGMSLRPWGFLAAAVPAGVLAAHFLYYMLRVGGDHFEYRVYSHLVPLLFVSGAWLLAQTFRGRHRVGIVLAALVVASWPIPWVHWAKSQHFVTRMSTLHMIIPIHDLFPAPLRPVVAAWDGWQEWLISRSVGMRHQEHKTFHLHRIARMVSREEGSKIRWEDGRPIARVYSVGIPAWIFPEVAIIDLYGLNDAVIARNPVPRTPLSERHMAHARQDPKGYLDCFRTNAYLHPEGHIVIVPRDEPLLDEHIRECESRQWY